MPRGGPDYGAPAYQVAASQVDTGDLITAIRGVNTVDGLGRPVLFETFGEGVNAWYSQGVGGGAVAQADASISEIPPACCYMSIGGTKDSSYSLINRTWRISGTRSAGAEAGFIMSSSQGSRVILLGFRVTDAYLIGGINIGYDGKLYYRDAAGDWVLLDSFVFSGANNAWISSKVVLDADLRNYKRIVVGQRSYDLTGLACQDLDVSTIEELSLTIQGISGAGVSNKIRVGHVIVTLDEP